MRMLANASTSENNPTVKCASGAAAPVARASSSHIFARVSAERISSDGRSSNSARAISTVHIRTCSMPSITSA